MLQIAETFGGNAATLRDERGLPVGAGVASWSQGDGDEDTFRPLGALAGAVVERLRKIRMETRALTAYVEGRAYADAYRQLVMLVLAREPGLKTTIQEIEAEALARVSTLSAMPIDGAEKITDIMDRVRSNVAASWSGSERTVAPRASEPSALAGQSVAPRRRGRPSLLSE
ncbi:hypothetical protein [Xanthobacter agilis]|uniref:Uncharacterized protein n=1 Tax=Xanthobacter agilis TaxID=47492 RepID=A0ABU0LFQ6_XANAG|nr:hypothetical protein [Xanthobacter agilis]MDQ0505976.1 hypothetical protein [Xanthobacter agilis]